MKKKDQYSVLYSQSNEFVSSPYAQEFSEQELKTMEFIISQTKKSDIELARNNQVKVISLDVKEFSQMIRAHPNDIYKRATDLSESLMKKQIKLKFKDRHNNDAFVRHSLITSMRYEEGQLTIGINPFVLPYFLDLKDEAFTQFRLENILRIGSSYGIKLYKMLKQYANSPWKYRDFMIEELREQFGIDNDKYNRYNDFKRNVIEMAIRHINKETDITVNYTEKKNGRKVSMLRFYIKSKLTQLQQAEIFFQETMNGLPDNCVLKGLWVQDKDNPHRINRFRKAFDKWLELSCTNYIEVSTDILEIETESNLFFNKDNVINEMIKAQFEKK